MKESKILKAISILGLLVLISTLILSIFTITTKENIYYNEEEYFKSDTFVETYMSYLYDSIYELIHNHDDIFYRAQDGEIEIHYSQSNNYYPYIKDKNYLIIYQNLALTNVELTNTTNTIQGIKEYISSKENAKNVNIINGHIQSESDTIQMFGVQYLYKLTEPYYTIELREGTGQAYKEYKVANVKDLEIYSSYIEEFEENTEIAMKSNLMDKLSFYEKYTYSAIPVSSILIIVIILYLIISTGHKKGVEGIALNDFDKIPLEIILIIATILGAIPIIILASMYNNYDAIMSLIITAYLLIYILILIVFNTIIKRIKSKTFLESSFVGLILLGMANCLEWLYLKYVSIFKTLTYSKSITIKTCIYFGLIIPTGIAIVFAVRDTFTIVILEVLLATVVAYKNIKTSKEYVKIENKLKEMYEGNNKNPLQAKDFGKEFNKSVKYINDISNGFENAIQDRMKSERLKAELITNVSHDIKTPLTSIINYVDLLKQENIQNEKAKEYIGILDNKSQRLKKLTEDLVEASKISTGNISLTLEKINVVELIKQALGEFEDKFKKRGLDVILDSKDNEISIKADNKCMYRIIENLFSNISKYALENSRVYVDIKKTQKNVIIEMKNISKDRLNITAEELMQRFVRGDKSRTTEGSGLGISIAQNLTELQGGKFNLKLDGDLFKVQLEWAI